MLNKVSAKYFDGLSSKPHLITISYTDLIDEFYIEDDAGSIVTWKSSDWKYEKYISILEIRNRNISSAYIQVDDQAFISDFYKSLKQNKKLDIYSRVLSLSLSKVIGLTILFFGLVVLAFFYLLPPLAERAATLLPESVDNQIGDSFMEVLIDTAEIDQAKTDYLIRFAAELDLQNRKKLRFLVVNSDEVNAFAVPNGQIVVYTGILEQMESYDELVSLLGHEVAHVNERHSMRMLSRNLAGYMFISLVFSDVNGIMAVLVDNAKQLNSLSYSRSFERAADKGGLDVLIRNNVDPNGMIRLFEHIERQGGVNIPQLISSHPLTSERKKDMRRLIDQTKYTIDPNDSLQTLFYKLKE